MIDVPQVNHCFTFDWLTLRAGWLVHRVERGGVSATFSAADRNDVLSVLLGAVADLLEGAAAVEFSFDLEPGEYAWAIHQADGLLRVSVVAYPDWSRSSAPRPTWSTDGLGLVDFAQEVVEKTEALLRRVGPEAYAKEWTAHPDPTPALQRARAALAQHRPR